MITHGHHANVACHACTAGLLLRELAAHDCTAAEVSAALVLTALAELLQSIKDDTKASEVLKLWAPLEKWLHRCAQSRGGEGTGVLQSLYLLRSLYLLQSYFLEMAREHVMHLKLGQLHLA